MSRATASVFVGLWIALSVTVSTGTAHAEPSCMDVMQVTGDDLAADEARVALSGGMLAGLPASSCDGLALHVEHSGDRMQVRLTRGERVVQHSAKGSALMASWVESWVAPSMVVPVASDPNHEQAPEQTSQAPATVPPTATAPAPDGSIPVRVALRPSISLDSQSPNWAGGEFALSLSLGPKFWIGMSAGGEFAPERKNVERVHLRLSVRTGYQHPLPWGAVRVGGGLGIVAASSKRELGNEVFRDEEAAAFFEAFSFVDVAMNATWSMSFGVALRGHLPDEFGPEEVEEDEPGEEFEPDPLSTFSASIMAGVSWGRRQ